MPAPRRIASLLSSATEMLYGIGLGDRVVAVSHECDFPHAVSAKPRVTFSNVDPNNGSREIDDQVKQTLAAGAPLYEIDSAQLAQLAPDLIVTQAQCDVCAVKYEDVVGMVEGCDVFQHTQVLALNPQSLEDIFEDVLRVGAATEEVAAAERFVESLRDRVAAVEQQTAVLSRRVRVACIEWIDPLMLAANWMPRLIRLAGGDDRLSHEGHSAYSNWSDVVALDPEVVIVMPCGFDLARTLTEAQPLAQWDDWSDLTAVKNQRVYAVDGNAYFNRSGPRIVDSLEILAYLLHPDLFDPPLEPSRRAETWRELQS